MTPIDPSLLSCSSCGRAYAVIGEGEAHTRAAPNPVEHCACGAALRPAQLPAGVYELARVDDFSRGGEANADMEADIDDDDAEDLHRAGSEEDREPAMAAGEAEEQGVAAREERAPESGRAPKRGASASQIASQVPPSVRAGRTRGGRDERDAQPDLGYGESHGYGPAHGGPTGPGDAPAREPAKLVPVDEDEKS